METILLTTEPEAQKIKLANLLYVAYRDNCLAFFTRNEIILTEGYIKDLLKVLPGNFVLLNRNTVANLDIIEKMSPRGRRSIIENSGSHRISAKQLGSLCRVLGAASIEYQNTRLQKPRSGEIMVEEKQTKIWIT